MNFSEADSRLRAKEDHEVRQFALQKAVEVGMTTLPGISVDELIASAQKFYDWLTGNDAEGNDRKKAA